MYIVKTLRMMNFLVREGFDCIKIKHDLYNPGKVVFAFEDSPKLRSVLHKYKS